ncbi:MAG: ribosome silencing factor [Bacteroidota bacterium]
MKISEQATSKQLANNIIEGIQDKNGKDIILLELKNVENSICDFFVICHGTSTTHVDAISESVERKTKEQLKEKPYRKEGLKNLTWVLMDYENVVVHIFQEEYRKFYNLEDLWADAKVNKIEDEHIK